MNKLYNKRYIINNKDEKYNVTIWNKNIQIFIGDYE